jgi:hypothetical protein
MMQDPKRQWDVLAGVRTGRAGGAKSVKAARPAQARNGGAAACEPFELWENRRVQAGTGTPRWRQAAVTVFASRQAMVIGPTPPGTGVMAPAWVRASS